MKVILTTDVPKIGKKDDVKDFNDGFAQNVLLSKGKAILATPRALTELENRKSSLKRKKEEELGLFNEAIKSLKEKDIIIKTKTNEKGSLFKSINERDVANEIKDLSGIEINESNIIMTHIKEIGVHKILLKKGEMKGDIFIKVESE